ncbi:MAG: phosphatase PAP2 family protein [Chitinophagaceae bacterium]|nr:phosphatase PAP2 family protein [Chitinophagaceae bacterium]
MDQRVPKVNTKTSLFYKKDIVITTIVSITYLLLSTWILGFKIDQLILALLFNVMYYLSHPTRRFITGFSIFIVYWIVFDFMKAIPNYQYNTVHIESLYNAEKTLFGIHENGKNYTPNEFFAIHSISFADLLTGIFYLCWVPVPLAMAAYLFYTNRRQFIYFSLTFFLVNLLGFVVYYIYPAAPPWYVQQYGFTFLSKTPGNTAGLSRFDAYVGFGVFKSLYAKSSNVFAAMPSLHSAYPIIVLYNGIKNKLGLLNIPFAIIMAGIWFAAVYTSHHYVLDVLAGMLCAITGIFIFNWFLVPDKRFEAFVIRFLIKMNTPVK